MSTFFHSKVLQLEGVVPQAKHCSLIYLLRLSCFNNMNFFSEKCKAFFDSTGKKFSFLRNVYEVLNKLCHSVLQYIIFFSDYS